MPLLFKILIPVVALCVIVFWLILARASKIRSGDEEIKEIVRRILDENERKNAGS